MITTTLTTMATISSRSKLRAGGVSWRKMMSNQRRRQPDSLAGLSCGVNNRRMGVPVGLGGWPAGRWKRQMPAGPGSAKIGAPHDATPPMKNTTGSQPRERHFLPVYRPGRIVLDHGMGSRVFDSDGREYVDFAAGIAVNSLGHAHPALNAALIAQAGRLWHTSNV